MTYDSTTTPFAALGDHDIATERVRELVDRFYDHMEADEAFTTIRRLHPPNLESSREKLFEFLVGWLGGPDLYVQKYGHPRLRGRHMPFAIGEIERDQWLACMSLALDDLAIEGQLRTFLDARFAHVANFMRNQ